MNTSKIKLLSTLVIFLSVLGACQNDLKELGSGDLSMVETEVAMDEAFEEVDDLAFTSMELQGIDGGRIVSDDRFSCQNVSIVHDPDNNKLTIDFGDGCEGPKGRVRKGIMEIVYQGKRFVPGSVVTTKLIDFYLDDLKIEGTRVVTNVATSLEDHPSFNVVITDGKVTWPDGEFATRNVDRTKTWIRAANPINDQFEVIGSANGTNKEGVAYTSQIIETIVFKRSCRSENVFIPVAGEKTISTDKRTISFDFGNGACDRLVTVSVNGFTKEVTF